MSTKKNESYDAITIFITENQEKIYRLAYSYVKSKDTALDIVQEAIYKGLKSYYTLDQLQNVKPWFYKILVNTAIDEIRHGKKIIVVSPENIPEESVDSLDEKAQSLVLQEALNQLEEKTKTVILLRYFEDMKLSDIATVLDENISSIKSRLYRGLNILKIQMNEEEKIHG